MKHKDVTWSFWACIGVHYESRVVLDLASRAWLSATRFAASYTAMTSTKETQALQKLVWEGSLPVEICLVASECRVYDQADPYLVRSCASTMLQDIKDLGDLDTVSTLVLPTFHPSTPPCFLQLLTNQSRGHPI